MLCVLKETAALLGEVPGIEMDDVHLDSTDQVMLTPKKVIVIMASIGVQWHYHYRVPAKMEVMTVPAL